jgi:Tol biopolymer transport system component
MSWKSFGTQPFAGFIHTLGSYQTGVLPSLKKYRLWAYTGLAAVGLLAVTAGVTQAAFPGGNGKIAFISTRDGNNEVYRMGATGTLQTRLTIGQGSDYSPARSPDGSKIAWTCERNGNQEICTMGNSGSGVVNRTNNPAEDRFPAWSPDGTRLVFQSNRGNPDPNDFDLYLLTIAGNVVTPLVANHPDREEEPSWSACNKIVYVHSTAFNNHVLRLVNPDGSGIVPLLPNLLPLNATAPDWSPDCLRIAFSGVIPGQFSQVHTINADGSGGHVQLTNTSSNSQPAYSPDGTKIAFLSVRDGNEEIYQMTVNGANPTNLTRSSASDFAPSWGSK